MDSSFVFFTKNGHLGIARKAAGRIVVYLNQELISESFQIEYNPEFNKLFDDQEEELTVGSLNIYLREQEIFEEVVATHELKSPGAYYPRIARENINFDYVTKEFIQDIRAYKNIQESLDSLFNYIEPEQINLKTYSHKIRELLILSCTEVEYLMKKMLLDNGYVRTRGYLNTVDYFKCKDILKLGEYEVVLKQYSDLKKFNPFKEWTDFNNQTTSSIPWYQAYNFVKHDRGGNIAEANLENLLDSVAAIHILLESQYGKNIFNNWKRLTDDQSMFNTLKYPEWALSEITAPILKIPSYDVKLEWIESKQYFSNMV
ncbi:hypothetical protein V3528_14015 [Acinetobacter johnsonii]|uniref:hypothetical protein n=1 Tax=Acinetobacter johnsonii TaxID=40214 RepID=UPI0030F5B1D4